MHRWYMKHTGGILKVPNQAKMLLTRTRVHTHTHTHTHTALVLCPSCVPEKIDNIKKV